MQTHLLTNSVSEISEALGRIVTDQISLIGDKYLLEAPNLLHFGTRLGGLEDYINSIDTDYQIPDLASHISASAKEHEESNTEKLIKKNGPSERTSSATFNDKVRSRVQELLLSISFQNLIDEKLESLPDEASDVDMEIEGFKIGHEEFKIFNGLAVILDLELYFIKEGKLYLKGSYFSNLMNIFTEIECRRVTDLSVFWFYMESRRDTLLDGIFDRNSIGDRISLLEIANSLTDRLQFKTAQGKQDSYRKDTYNDKIQSRIRTFLANMLALEDNTGLNKYFTTANRMVKEIVPSSRVKGNRTLLKDVILLKKLFNDPYYFLKNSNHKNLQKTAEVMHRVYQTLIEDEIKSSSAQTKEERFMKSGKGEAKRKNSYFAEAYWKTPFEDTRKQMDFEKHMSEDLENFAESLTDRKVRQTLILQIYILCNFYYELNSTNKKDFIQSIGAPSNTKHIVDDSPPDSLVSLFFKIKKEIPKALRSMDHNLSFLFLHLGLTEVFWYGLLIYGKDPSTGKSYFQDKSIDRERLENAQEKIDRVFPKKTKRYFNLYATPQLSRKMKTPTGLELLKSTGLELVNFDVEIEVANKNLNVATDINDRKRLLEDRNLLIWKKQRSFRSTNWLDFGSQLSKETLEDNRKVSHISSENKQQ